jgi:hypothetical protein
MIVAKDNLLMFCQSEKECDTIIDLRSVISKKSNLVEC